MSKGKRNRARRKMRTKYINNPRREIEQEYDIYLGYRWRVSVPKGQMPDPLDLMINPARRVR